MSAIKNLLDEIANCEICEGNGITNEWVSQDGDYDFEWCDCNPEHLTLEYDFADYENPKVKENN